MHLRAVNINRNQKTSQSLNQEETCRKIKPIPHRGNLVLRRNSTNLMYIEVSLRRMQYTAFGGSALARRVGPDTSFHLRISRVDPAAAKGN